MAWVGSPPPVSPSDTPLRCPNFAVHVSNKGLGRVWLGSARTGKWIWSGRASATRAPKLTLMWGLRVLPSRGTPPYLTQRAARLQRRVRPAPKLFDAEEVRAKGEDVSSAQRGSRGRAVYYYDGQEFEDGFLVRTLKSRPALARQHGKLRPRLHPRLRPRLGSRLLRRCATSQSRA